MTDTELVSILRISDAPTARIAADRIEALTKEVDALKREVAKRDRIIETERASTLHRNLCSDHYDKLLPELACVMCDLERATRRAERAEAEVERLNKRRCETCEHGFYGDCLRAVQTHNSALDEWREYVTCETFGGGCQAWEEKHG